MDEVEIVVRAPHFLNHCGFCLCVPPKKQSHLAATGNPVSMSISASSGAAFPGGTGSQPIADEPANPIALPTSATPEAASPGRTGCLTVADETPDTAFLGQPPPSAYIDAVMALLPVCVEDMVEGLETDLEQRTQELCQAKAVINVLSNAACLGRARANLSDIHASLKAIQREILDRETRR
ncbi:hypothetical protein ACFL5Q_02335 [Planctomycetota bacterium]